MRIDANKVAYNVSSSCVNFWVEINGNSAVWRVNEEVLIDDFGAMSIDASSLEATTRDNLFTIAQIARRKFLAGMTDPDGAVTVNKGDR